MARSDVSAAAPVVAAVTAFGVPYGVLATAAGFPWWLTVAMSLTVFAGSAQFTLVSVFGSAGSPLSAVLTAALLNTRYLATGAAAARVLPGGRLRRFLLGQLVVDESYALGVGARTAAEPDDRVMVRAGTALYVGWAAGSLVGALVGDVIGDPARLGVDAAFPALFVALLWPLLSDRRMIRAAVVGAATALVLTPVAGAGVALAGAAAAGLITHR